jgi:hypothetical protein
MSYSREEIRNTLATARELLAKGEAVEPTPLQRALATPLEDKLERWRRENPQAPEPEAKLDTRPPWIDWAEVDRRVAATIAEAIEAERGYLLAVTAEALGQILVQVREDATAELEKATGALRLELSEAKAQIAEVGVKIAEMRCAQAERAAKSSGTVLDLSPTRTVN